MNKRLNGKEYGEGTMVLGIRRVKNRSKAEKSMKDWFSSHGGIIVKGQEYYQLSDLNEAYDLFNDAVLERDYRNSDVYLFEPKEWIHKVSLPKGLVLI